jgi:uncharacterized lipoprotein YajG
VASPLRPSDGVLRQRLRLATVAVGAAILTACVSAPDRPDYRTEPPAGLFRVAHGTTVPFMIVVRDQRPVKDDRLVRALTGALTAGLSARGFHPGAGTQTLSVTVEHLYIDAAPGFWSHRVASEAVVRVQFVDAGGTVRFDQRFVGKSDVLRGRQETVAQAHAYDDVVRRLLNDETLVSALNTTE